MRVSMKVPNKILGKIFAITKGIHLNQPTNLSVRTDGFTSGDGTSVGRRQVVWWITFEAVRETQELASMVKDFDSQLADADRPTIQLEIDRVIKDNMFNDELFNIRDVLYRRAPTLFDAIASSNKQEFAERLWEKIYQALINLIPSWLSIYPLRGVASASADIGFDGLSLMSPNDEKRWQEYITRYPSTVHFEQSKGSPERFSSPTIWDIKLPTAEENKPFTWLVCEAKGTRHGVKRIVAGRMRTFIAVLFSLWHPSSGDFFVVKSDLGEHRCSIQFAPAGNREENSIIPENIGRLMPSLIVNFAVSSSNITQLRDWYTRLYSAHEELQRRAIAASHFLHYGIMADGLQRFINYYIALDALFGERHKVEENIRKGIEQMFPNDQAWIYRADRLFDLRSELVHGGTSSIDGWKDFDAYMRHVRTSPSEDAANAAMTALRTYFINPPQFLTLPPA